jgi:hypothetical protein
MAWHQQSHRKTSALALIGAVVSMASVCNYDDPICDTSDFVPDLAMHWYFPGLVLYFSASSASSFVNLGAAIHGSYAYIQPVTLAGKLMGRFITANG